MTTGLQVFLDAFARGNPLSSTPRTARANRPPFPAFLLTQQRCAVFGKSAEVCFCHRPRSWRSFDAYLQDLHATRLEEHPSCMPCGPTTAVRCPVAFTLSSTTARPSPNMDRDPRSPRDGSGIDQQVLTKERTR